MNLNLWVQLQEAVDIFGLAALDRLFCFKIVRELQVSYANVNLLCGMLRSHDDHMDVT